MPLTFYPALVIAGDLAFGYFCRRQTFERLRNESSVVCIHSLYNTMKELWGKNEYTVVSLKHNGVIQVKNRQLSSVNMNYGM